MRILTMIFLLGLLCSFTYSIEISRKKWGKSNSDRHEFCHSECFRKNTDLAQCKLGCDESYGIKQTEDKEKVLCDYTCQGKRKSCKQGCRGTPGCRQKCYQTAYLPCIQECNVNNNAAKSGDK